MSRSVKLPGGLFFRSGSGKFAKKKWNRKARYANFVDDGGHYKKYSNKSTILYDRYSPFDNWGEKFSRK